MRKIFSGAMILAAGMFLVSSISFAQSVGESTYKAKCQSCHGANGTPTPLMAKSMNLKSASDPAVKSKSEAAQIELTKKGVGKMQGYAGKLTDEQIKASVEYFRSLGK